ncbi:expressed protein [Chlorella variabilis]|uniref:Expressed protein n=1 Tax=Chlorella variabilis TaxID=554065 RepID=E1ZQG2_CHLVA|nr:expressed protein [Chlorella variabilis]EFN51927.1 expressed protein [Chlorella variabilis]|eukprot:XP_005844029.1 expressed protein [Chlorella variabilis]
MPGLPLEFTVTGLPRAERAELPELAARMRATYCPALRVGCTAAVVVDPDAKLNWTEGKLLAAATHCIPVVSSAWLTDSLVHGFLLSMGNYVVAPTRTSAATTSVAAVPGPVAPSAAAQATAEAHVPRHAATPASPEKLRGEVRPPPASPRAAPFLEPSATPAAGGSPAGTAQQQLLQQPSHARMLEAAAVQDPLPSPASPAQQRTGSQAAAALLSPLTCSPLPLPDLSPDLLLAAGSKLREAAGSNPRTAPSPRAQELDALNADDEREERQEDGQGAGSSQEQGQVARDGTPNSCSSDALWAARMQQQGEAAGQLNDSPSSYSVGGTDWLGMDSAAATPADSQPGAFRPARTASITMSRHPFVTFNRGTSKVMPSSPAGTPAGSAAGKERGPNATGTFPSTSHFRLGGSSGLLWQLRRHSEGGSSLLGSLSGTGTPERPGSASQGSFSSRGSGGHVLQPGGQELTFEAGDPGHGAIMLYDIQDDGQLVYAKTLVQSIYQLHEEAWMEHRYCFTKQDMLSRQEWAAALKNGNVKSGKLKRYSMADGELLLSSGTYHSPMHLISGDFWLTFPGLVRQGRGKGQTVGRQQQRAAGDGAKDAPCGGQKLPTYTCRKGFDVAKRVLVPLQRALEGWSSAA